MMVSSYVSSQRSDLPATFESLNDDTLTTTLQLVGDKSYRSFGGINKRCKEVYITSGMEKKTFLFGYAPLSVIQDRYDNSYSARDALSKGVLFYNRKDVLDWALQERKKSVLNKICKIAAEEERLDLLNKVWNNIEDDDDEDLFEGVDRTAAQCGKLNVLKWFETKGLSIKKEGSAGEAAEYGHLHILQWLQEEKGLELDGDLYMYAIYGGHLHVMKWLRERGCPWDEETFSYAARNGNLEILQWLHNEGCPWTEVTDDDLRVYEHLLDSDVIDWCHLNGYGNRVYFGDDDDY